MTTLTNDNSINLPQLLDPPTPPAPATPGTPSDEEMRVQLLARQATRIADLQAEIQARQEEIDQLKAQILDTHEPGTYHAGGLKITVRTGSRRLDPYKFHEKYAPAKYPTLYELKPLALSRVEKQVGSLALEGMIQQGANTVTIA